MLHQWSLATLDQSDSGPDYIGRILELFEGIDGSYWFCAQWFYRPGDTAIGQGESTEHDKKRVFLSTMKDDNLLECITLKLNIIHVPALRRQVLKCPVVTLHQQFRVTTPQICYLILHLISVRRREAQLLSQS